jgi:hypothetical protein
MPGAKPIIARGLIDGFRSGATAALRAAAAPSLQPSYEQLDRALRISGTNITDSAKHTAIAR